MLMKHRSYMYAYLLSVVRNPHDAEDLLQEASVVALRRADQHASVTNFKAWFSEIRHNLLMRHAKKSSRSADRLTPELLER